MAEQVRYLSLNEIHALDLEVLRSDQAVNRAAHLQQISQMLNEFGFLIVGNHGVNLDLLDECYELSKRFFDLSVERKAQLQYDLIDQKKYSNVGYFPFRSEKALRSDIADIKEFFHVGPALTAGHPMKEYYAENVWPSAIPNLERSFIKLYDEFKVCADLLMYSLCELFKIPQEYAEELVKNGNSILRTIHYPPVAADEKAMRAAPHTGIQLLGLQPRTTHPGLQMYTPRGEWIALGKEFEDYLVINIGEMFAYLVDNQVTATLHQVVNAMDDSQSYHRYCIVFFYHANPLQYLLPEGKAPIRVGDWLLKRLQELGLFLAD